MEETHKFSICIYFISIIFTVVLIAKNSITIRNIWIVATRLIVITYMLVPNTRLSRVRTQSVTLFYLDHITSYGSRMGMERYIVSSYRRIFSILIT